MRSWIGAMIVVVAMAGGCGGDLPPLPDVVDQLSMDDGGPAVDQSRAPAPDLARIHAGGSCTIPDGVAIACCPSGSTAEECPAVACDLPANVPAEATTSGSCCDAGRCCAFYQANGPTHPIVYKDCGDGWKCFAGCTP